MAVDLIIDCESLSQKPNAVILSLGVIAIDAERDAGKSFEELLESGEHWKFDVAEQRSFYKRDINKETVQWWAGQGESAKEILRPDPDRDISITKLPELLTDYCKSVGYTKGFIWTRGMIDGTWVQSVQADLGVSNDDFCMKWWSYRDVRTFIDTLLGTTNGYIPKGQFQWPRGVVKHNAMHDAALDAMQMFAAVKIANGEDPSNDFSQWDDDIPF